MKTFFVAALLIALVAGSHAEKDEDECKPLAEVAGEESILVQAADAAGLLDLLLEGNITILAPTDDAFLSLIDALGVTAEELLDNEELLQEVLAFHVVPGTVKAEDFGEGGEVATLLSESTCDTTMIDVTVDDDGVMIGGGLTEATVTTADVEACDKIVVHVIDTVLVPCPPMIGSAAGGSGSASGGSG